MNIVQTNSGEKVNRMLPVIIDLLAVVVGVSGLSMMADILVEPSGWNAFLLVMLYVFFCFGVYFVRKLIPQKLNISFPLSNFFLNPKVRAVLAFLFGLLMMTTMAYQLGYFASIQSIRSAGLDEGSSSALFVYMPGALLGFSMLYILVLAFPVNESVPPGSRGSMILTALGLGLINIMLLFCAAQAKALVGEGMVNNFFLLIIVLVVLVVSFAPPRIIFHSKVPTRSSLLTFGFLLLIISWMIVR